MTTIILAGGKSIRMGFDKAFTDLGGVTLIEKQIKLLRSFFKNIIVVTNTPEKYKGIASSARLSAKPRTCGKTRNDMIIKDIIPGCGPLSGIYSGLKASESLHNFVVACDMPFIDTRVIEYMCKKAAGYDVVIPRTNNKYEPLFCIYSKNCLKPIQQLIEKKIFKIISFFPEVKVKIITGLEIRRFSRPEKIFMNINTPRDIGKISNG